MKENGMFAKDKIKIIMFPAGAGDCILVEFLDEDYRILIDGGYADTYHSYLKNYLHNIANGGKRINLLIITHIDCDHIGGIQAFLFENGSANNPTIIGVDEVWYNAFWHMSKEKKYNEVVPYVIKEKLRGEIAAQNIMYGNGKHDISVSQGSTVAGLLRDNGYNWNSMWSGKAVCVENGEYMKLTDKIRCRLYGPDEKALIGLAKLWVSKLKGTVRKFKIYDDNLYSDAFECYFMKQGLVMTDATKKDISYKANEKEKEIDWESLADSWSGQVDESPTNRSSIAIMLEYEGVRMLFPGDSPLQLLEKKIPCKIDIVKLPHHGSEKNIDKNFILNTEVSYYLLSTEGKKHGHPSKAVIGSILYQAPQSPLLVKNYDISHLKNIGVLMRYEYE